MKILELRLEKFGHFEARTLDLSAGASGLHVIHGANEAGKSTSLRAILALLYGFPKQTPDDFRFAYKDLRVGARIEGADGRVHDVVRLKRDKNSLLYADGRPADEGLMRSLLAGVDRAVFERVFGLDQKRLREGGEELQKGGGVLGESLFAAGIGLAQIRKLRDALESEADALFAPRATTKTINELAAKADTLRAEADAAALRAEDHEARERRLADARETSERLAGDIAALDETIARIERRMRARPKFDDLDATERELAELADVPDLPESFAAELTQAATARRTFMNAVQKAEDALTATRHQRAKISVAQRVLDRADAIRELYGQLEAYRRARADLPEAEAERRALAEEAAALLRDLDPSLAA
ncbi:MAG: AAA family ATPase, partial [Deltaproteobacteria bacterium]|nr:AAA family ATPase [Deltaproteobacteria bacterium]